LTQQPDFWDNPQQAAEIQEELSDLEHEIGFIQNTEKELLDMERMEKISKNDRELNSQIKQNLQALKEKIEKEEVNVFLSGKYDRKDAILSIYAGAGGVDAQDWGEMLLRMYQYYAQNQGFKVKLLDITSGQEAGIKNATLEIKGKFAYGYLKKENGVHRLVRLSPFNADSLRHTSFVLVEVLPEMSKDIQKEIEIKPEDLKIDTFRASGPGGQYVNRRESAVRITHLSTKLAASCQSERSQAQNKEKAQQLLYNKLFQKKLKEEKKKKEKIRGDLPSAEWGNQIRSYVLHPYKMVKDLRTGVESSDPEEVLDGKIDKFIQAELKIK